MDFDTKFMLRPYSRTHYAGTRTFSDFESEITQFIFVIFLHSLAVAIKTAISSQRYVFSINSLQF